jgi:hypothetical protein
MIYQILAKVFLICSKLSRRLEALRAAGILDLLNKLDAKWRKALDDVCAGRSVYELSDDDKKRVVDVWHRSEFS